jgi:hypothetical protein
MRINTKVLLLNLIRRKCRLCSRFSSGLKELVRKIFRTGVDCQALHQRTYYSDVNRAVEINTAAPDCSCEKYRLSRFSPRPVENIETLVRFVVSPVHFNVKKNILKPSVFSYAFDRGCSMQRENIATNAELADSVGALIKKSGTSWLGVLIGSCSEVRQVTSPGSTDRAICVYDTAEEKNPAHCEMFQTQYVIEETFRGEITEQLMRIFDNGNVIPPTKYRDGSVQSLLS